MRKDDRFREAIPPEPAMVLNVIPVDDPDSDKMEFSLIIVLSSQHLAGFQPIVWQKAGLIGYAEFRDEMKTVLTQGFLAINRWLPGAVEASRNLCPEPTGKYKSVWLCEEHEAVSEMVESRDMMTFDEVWR